ncbi:MAG: hypothetical protein M1837_007506 [Sclerophora amabilis]|nr:MAG: hypothetical protein M1837_007506 [Sclerophora amabilis]
MSTLALPERYTFEPTPHVPNSPLPVLIYRAALLLEGDHPNDETDDSFRQPSPSSVRDLIERNGWIQGGVFKTFWSHHFHSVTHECYAVFKGESKLLLGRGPLDDAETYRGTEVVVRCGDVIVLPGSPKYDNNFCKAGPDETIEKALACSDVPVPESDPVFGLGGPLVGIWKDALASAKT